MIRRKIIRILCLVFMLALFSVTASAATEISSVTVTNVPKPMEGDRPTISATVNTTGAQLYSLDWYDKTAGRFLESYDTFIEGHIYEVQLWVEAEDGYKFRVNGLSSGVTATVRGENATVTKAYEYQLWAMVVVSYTFEPCQKREIRSVDIRLDYITKNGNILLAEEWKSIPFSIQSGDDQVKPYPEFHTRYFPYGFHWSNSTKDTVAYKGDAFKGGCDYYVTIALKPRDDKYVFADDFTATICGKGAQIRSLGKTYAEISVEVTCFGTIYAGNINPVVVLPRDGSYPDYGLYYGDCEHIEYANVVGWYDEETGKRLLTSEDKFHTGKQYRVEVECTAAYGYKFQRDANDRMEYTPMITGAYVDSYSFGYDSYRGRETIKLVKVYTVEAPLHTHTSGSWQCDDSGHKKYCTICGEDMGGSAHYGGNATCAEKAKCTVCGYGYGKLKDHKWSTRYQPVNADGHALQCDDCKGYDTVIPHDPGPEATETSPQLCKDCGYIIEPAKKHIHKLTSIARIEPDCTDKGCKEYYTCDGCSKIFEDKDCKIEVPSIDKLILEALGHTASQEWKQDENSHWHICVRCNNTIEDTKKAHEINNGKCTVCGYTATSYLPETKAETESATATAPEEQTKASVEATSVPEQTKASAEATSIPEQTTASAEDTTPLNTEKNNTDGQKKDLAPFWVVIIIIVILAVVVIAAVLMTNKKRER